MSKEYKLDFEFVPEECWYSNLRSVLKAEDWDKVRKDAYKRAGGRCSVCGGLGRLEAHEKWEYDDQNRVQKLNSVIALCSACHLVKHISRAYLVGKGGEAMEQFIKVNKCSQMEYHEALQKANEEYVKRNKIEGWVTDISWLKDKFNIILR